MTDTLTILEAEDQEPERRLVAIPDQMAGTLAMASMSDEAFNTRLAALKKGRDRIATVQRELMTKDVDYGVIPGTPKPTLLKPGAEKLCDIYGLRADFAPVRHVGDNTVEPALGWEVRCELHLGSLDGPVVAVGYGSANSWERKHRYRTGQRACPACGTIGTLLRSKRGQPEWFCWAKKGGCGETFQINDPAVVEQQVGDIENPDPFDLDTTLLKMAEKRAHVDATLRATAASGLFTQDVEDRVPPEEPPPPTEPEPSLAEVISQRKAEVTEPAPKADQPTKATGTTPPGPSSTATPPAVTSTGDSTDVELERCASVSKLSNERCRREQGHGNLHRTENEAWTEADAKR